MNKYYVYIWYIEDTNEVFYVGKGSGDRYKRTRKRNKFFKDMYNTHKCAVKIIEDSLTENEAFKREIFWIKYYRENTNYRLTNICDGGEGASGLVHTEESKQKISKLSKEKWADEEWKNKIIQDRYSKDSTYQSEEFKEKISSLVKGENNPNYGNYWTEEQKERLRIKQKESGRYIDDKNPSAKKIKCVETNEEFSCIKFASEKYGLKSQASITICLNNPNRTAAGLHWVIV